MSSNTFVSTGTWSHPHATSRDSPTQEGPVDPFVSTVHATFRHVASEHGITVHGDGPLYVNSDGLTVNLANLVAECVGERAELLRHAVRHFVTALIQVMSVDPDPAMSTDVAAASFRLRLIEDSHVLGAPVFGNAEELDRPDSPAVISRPAFPGSSWLLYVKRPNVAQNVRPQDLDLWGLDTEEAFDLARRNAMQIPISRRRKALIGWECAGGSLYIHNLALRPHEIEKRANHGWYVGIPTRNVVYVRRASPSLQSIDDLCRFMMGVRAVWADEPHPLCRHSWYVPPEGVGDYGCNAEPIVFTSQVESVTDDMDLRPRFGPRLHQLWGETPPVRPNPELVL
jgi:hypothetical protein